MIIGVWFLLAIFAVVILVSMNKTRMSADFKEYMDARRVGRIIKENIATINQQGRGYYKYFSIPWKLTGNKEYTINVKNGVLDIEYGGRSHSMRLSTDNITIYSMDKGVEKKNRVRYGEEGIFITGHRPNLKPREGSLQAEYNQSTGNVTLSVLVVNDAHVEASSSWLRFTQKGGTQKSLVQPVVGLNPEEQVWIEAETTPVGSQFTLRVELDIHDSLNEGIEIDNKLNKTVDLNT